jgi:hypothetical protein
VPANGLAANATAGTITSAKVMVLMVVPLLLWESARRHDRSVRESRYWTACTPAQAVSEVRVKADGRDHPVTGNEYYDTVEVVVVSPYGVAHPICRHATY